MKSQNSLAILRRTNQKREINEFENFEISITSRTTETNIRGIDFTNRMSHRQRNYKIQTQMYESMSILRRFLVSGQGKTQIYNV